MTNKALIRKFFYITLLFYSSCFAQIDLYKILFYNSLVPENINLRKRIVTTICCDDCDNLPKVENAGKILTIGKETCQLMHNGIKVVPDCYYGHWMTVLIELLKGHHEPQEEKCFHEVLKHIPNNAIMVELGSYWAYYSMWFGQQIPNAKNYLIEPDPKNLSIGQNNFALNNMRGNFIQAMVGAYNVNNQTFVDWDYNRHKIRQISIDEFALENNIDFIHILHSDIQGAEIDMLKGCQKLIAEKRIGYFFLSTHRETHQDCLKLLQKEPAYEIMLSVTRKESFSADGLIIAKLITIDGPEKLEVSRRTEAFCTIIDWISNEKIINF